jgi:hypothetical protein
VTDPPIPPLVEWGQANLAPRAGGFELTYHDVRDEGMEG